MTDPTLPFGVEGLWWDLGEMSLSSLGGRALLEGGGRGLVNAAAQYTGNRIANWNGGWIAPFRNINWLSVGFSAANINFGSNAILSGNFRLNFNSGFSSTLTGTISPLNAGGTMLGGVFFGEFRYRANNFGLGSSYFQDLWWDFLFSSGETGLGF